MKTPPRKPSRKTRTAFATTALLALLIGAYVARHPDGAASQPASGGLPALPGPAAAGPELPPWSEVLPPAHGVNPLPAGFVPAATYEDVATLAFPTPGPVPAGLRARVILGERPAAGPRHRRVRIEEIASIDGNRLLERRVMPADHALVILAAGKTEADLRLALPPHCALLRTLLRERHFLVSTSASSSADALPRLLGDLRALRGLVVSVSADGFLFSAALPDDPEFGQQWALHDAGGIDMNGPEAWDHSTGSAAATVAVIDSGIDLDHPDLVPNLWQNPAEPLPDDGEDGDGNDLDDDAHGWDFVNGDNNPDDDFGHGTHVAGIIGARGNNGTGVTGVCWDVRLVSLKVLDSTGAGLWSDVLDAVTYANAKDLKVANLSFGAYGSAPVGVQLAFEEADRLLFCAAAGNGGFTPGGGGDDIDRIQFVPASFLLGNVISVIAVGRDGQPAAFSNFGHVGTDIAAPGVDIRSTAMGGGYEDKEGTSMAAAFVSGAAALLQTHKLRSPVRLREMLQAGPLREPRLSGSCATQGRLDLEKVALQASHNIRWRHIGEEHPFPSDYLSHVLPDGSLRAWRLSGSGEVHGDNRFPARNILAVLSDTPFVIDTDFRLITYSTAGSVAVATELATAMEDDGPHPPNSLGVRRFSYVSGGTNVIDACGFSFDHNSQSSPAPAFLFLRSDGTVWSFGTSNSWTGRAAPPFASASTPAPVQGLSDIIQIASHPAGNNHFALRKDGVLFVFGQNGNHLLGLGHADPVPTPVPVPGLPPVTEFSILQGSVACLTHTGALWAWHVLSSTFGGDSETYVTTPTFFPAWGPLVDFTFGYVSAGITPFATTADGVVLTGLRSPLGGVVPVAGLPPFVEAPDERFGIDRRGRVWEGGSSKLYRGADDPFDTSTEIVPLSDAAFDVAAGSTTAIALLADGRTQAWGLNDNFSFGIGTHHQVPVAIPQLFGFEGVGAVNQIAWGWKSDGQVRSLGASSSFSSTNILPYDYPALPSTPSLKDVERYYNNSHRFVALTSDGNLSQFNSSEHFTSEGTTTGQLWQVLPSLADIQVFGPSSSIRSGLLALDGADRFWFQDFRTNNLPAPVNVTGVLPEGFASVKRIAIGGDGILILCEDGRLWTCASFEDPAGVTLATQGLRMIDGLPLISQLGEPLALGADGSVWEILRNGNPPVEIPGLYPPGVPVAPIVKVTAVTSTSPTTGIALRSDGTLWSWGQYSYSGHPGGGGTLAPAMIPSLTDAVDIWSGFRAAYVMRPDGSVWGWGSNTQGLLGGASYAEDPIVTPNYNTSTEVKNSGLGINDWLTTHFSNEELGSIFISGDEADPDLDGLTNLLEYALGTNPKDPSPVVDERELGLTVSFEAPSSKANSLGAAGTGPAGQTYFTARLDRVYRRQGLLYQIQISDDLVAWTANPTRVQIVTDTEHALVVRDIHPVSQVARRFARLIVVETD